MPGLCSAQSSPVLLDVGSDTLQNRQSMTVDRVPGDLSPTVRVVERQLAQATPESWRSEMSVNDLRFAMSRTGLRVYLDESARDSNLDESAIIRLALHNASVDENLRFALHAFQCDYTILDSGTIVIASEDELIDRLQTRITFDITNLPQDPQMVAQSLQESIDPDGWEDYGGMGRIQVVASSSRHLLVVSNTYQNTRQVRRLLDSFSAMSGATGMPATQRLLAGASTPVQLPDDYQGAGEGAVVGSRGNGRGFGGSGLGGGVF
jgi:hypothetical protein